MTPRVSVIIPTYNRKESLLRTLESLRRQTYPADRFEVIVVDDGSSDGTGDAVAQCRLPFALKYVYHTNQGDAIARNTGARLALGDVLVFLDDDIRVEPQFLEGMVKPHGGRRIPHRNARLLALRDAALGRWGPMGPDVAAAIGASRL